MNREAIAGAVRFPGFLLVWSGLLALLLVQHLPADAATRTAAGEPAAALSAPAAMPALPPALSLADAAASVQRALARTDLAAGRWQPQSVDPLETVAAAVVALVSTKPLPVLAAAPVEVPVVKASLVKVPVVKGPAPEAALLPAGQRMVSIPEAASFDGASVPVKSAPHKVKTLFSEAAEPARAIKVRARVSASMPALPLSDSVPAPAPDLGEPGSPGSIAEPVGPAGAANAARPVVAAGDKPFVKAPAAGVAAGTGVRRQDADVLKAFARARLQAGRVSEGLYQAMRERVAEFRGDAEYLGLFALTALQTHRPAEAEVIYAHLLAAEPDNARWLTGIGVARAHQARVAAAPVAEALGA